MKSNFTPIQVIFRFFPRNGGRRVAARCDEVGNCAHDSHQFQVPVCAILFDIHYNARLEGRDFSPQHPLPYALVVSVQAKKIGDLYDQIVRKYATRLEPLRPTVAIPLKTKI